MTFFKSLVRNIYIYLAPNKREPKQPPVIIPREVTPLDLRFETTD
jgi:hypothetical protein